MSKVIFCQKSWFKKNNANFSTQNWVSEKDHVAIISNGNSNISQSCETVHKDNPVPYEKKT